MQTKTPLSVRVNGLETQPLAIILVVLVVIVAVVTGALKIGGPSDIHPPSMKQLAFLRRVGYDGPMPTSSRQAWEIISDIKRGGDGKFDSDYHQHKRRSRFR